MYSLVIPGGFFFCNNDVREDLCDDLQGEVSACVSVCVCASAHRWVIDRPTKTHNHKQWWCHFNSLWVCFLAWVTRRTHWTIYGTEPHRENFPTVTDSVFKVYLMWTGSHNNYVPTLVAVTMAGNSYKCPVVSLLQMLERSVACNSTSPAVKSSRAATYRTSRYKASTSNESSRTCRLFEMECQKTCSELKPLPHSIIFHLNHAAGARHLQHCCILQKLAASIWNLRLATEQCR